MAMLWIGQELRSLNAPVERDGDAIGRLAAKKGVVKIRPINSLLWSEAGAREPVFAGDTLATGGSGQVSVRLNDDRRLKVERNSMVTIDVADHATQSSQLTIDLKQGEVRVANAVKKDKTLLNAFLESVTEPEPSAVGVRTGGAVYAMDAAAGSSLKVVQPLEGPAAVTGFTGTVTVKETDGAVRALAPAEVVPIERLPPVIAPRPQAPPREIPRLAVIDIEPPVEVKPPPVKRAPKPAVVDPVIPSPPSPPMAARVVGAAKQMLFSPRPLQCPGLASLTVALQATGDGERGDGWRAFADVGVNGQTTRLFAAPSATMHELSIPGDALCPRGSSPERINLTLKGGGQAADGRERIDYEQKNMVLTSLHVVGGQPVTAFLKALDAAPSLPKVWLPLTGVTGDHGYPYELRLYDGTLLPRLGTFFARDGAVALQPGAATMSRGMHFVRGGRIVASLRADQAVAGARPLALALGAELAFFGDHADYKALPTPFVSKLEVLEGLLEKNSNVYVFSRNRLVAIAESDVKDSSGALATVVMTSRAVFNEKVELLVP